MIAPGTDTPPFAGMWGLPELIEAAMRAAEVDVAQDALERLVDTTRPASTGFGLGVEARSRALLSDGEAAEESYREAIDRLSRTRLAPELARAHLVYGEWLRRENRRVDARGHLREAHEQFNVDAGWRRSPRSELGFFLSQHTVAYHLRKVFSKLGISSRRELASALPSSQSELVPD